MVSVGGDGIDKFGKTHSSGEDHVADRPAAGRDTATHRRRVRRMSPDCVPGHRGAGGRRTDSFLRPTDPQLSIYREGLPAAADFFPGRSHYADPGNPGPEQVEHAAQVQPAPGAGEDHVLPAAGTAEESGGRPAVRRCSLGEPAGGSLPGHLRLRSLPAAGSSSRASR